MNKHGIKFYISVICAGTAILLALAVIAQSWPSRSEGAELETTPKKIVTEPDRVQSVQRAPVTVTSTYQEKDFGTSAKGRSIRGYEFGTGKESLLLFSALHGDEKNTAALLNVLVETLKNDPLLVHESKKIVVIPVTNPDGYYEPSLKNLNANGVNLNRNFETSDWRRYPANGVFAGKQAFSEIESRVMRDVIQAYQPSTIIAFHSQGGLISPEENEVSIRLAKWYAGKSGYQYFDEWDYPGTITKWFVETTSGSAITVELSDHVQDDWKMNKDALIELISSANLPRQ